MWLQSASTSAKQSVSWIRETLNEVCSVFTSWLFGVWYFARVHLKKVAEKNWSESKNRGETRESYASPRGYPRFAEKSTVLQSS